MRPSTRASWWSASRRASAAQPFACWRTSFATQDGQIVNTVSRAEIHLDVTRDAWAELTMFATADGRPALNLATDGLTLADVTEGGPDGESRIRERTFNWLIEFSQESPEARAAAMAASPTEGAGQ